MLKKSKNKGITLIALVITIIVLLILAGISISMLSGDNSILSRAGQVRDDAIITRENEQIKLAVNSSIIDELGKKANAKGVRKYFKSQGDKVSVYQNEDELEIEYLDTGHTYIVKANGEIIKQEGNDTEEKNVYYKIDSTTLYLSSIKKDESYKEIEDYYFNSYDDAKLPEWVGEITVNEAGKKVLPTSSIKKVVVEDRIQPKNTSCWLFQCVNLSKIDNIGRIDTRNTINMSKMFYNCLSLTALDVSNFDTIKVTNMNGMFYNCNKLTALDTNNFNTSNVTDMIGMFQRCASLTSLDVSNFNTSNVTNMNGMFSYCTNIISLDVSNFDTGNVTIMKGMFYNCNKLTSLDVSNFETSNVTNMYGMFYNCNKLTSLDVSNFNTSNVTNMSGMFQNCTSFTSLDVSSFNTSKVTNMAYMFAGGSSSYKMNFTGIKGLDKFDTSNVTDMNTMFQWCYKMTTIDVSHFDTSKVTNLDSMFWSCEGLTSIDLSNFETNTVTNTGGMFHRCLNLKNIYVNETKFNMSNVTDSTNMFNGCIALEGSNGTKYNSSKIDVSMAHVDKEGNPGYFSSK